jgi:mannose-6-phosphate isomerase-like protein (cupin superfamily)
MTDVTAKRFEEMESAVGGVFVRARAELGVTAFGMQVFNLPPGFDAPFSAHKHQDLPPELAFADHGQEEVYVPLHGSGTLVAGDERIALRPGMAVRVGPSQIRQIVTGDEPLQYLAIGGTPDRAYEAPAFTELGAGEEPPGARALREAQAG